MGDKTEKLVKESYRKTIIINNYYNDEQDISASIKLILEEMININYKEICKGLMYCLSFRNPF